MVIHRKLAKDQGGHPGRYRGRRQIGSEQEAGRIAFHGPWNEMEGTSRYLAGAYRISSHFTLLPGFEPRCRIGRSMRFRIGQCVSIGGGLWEGWVWRVGNPLESAHAFARQIRSSY